MPTRIIIWGPASKKVRCENPPKGPHDQGHIAAVCPSGTFWPYEQPWDLASPIEETTLSGLPAHFRLILIQGLVGSKSTCSSNPQLPLERHRKIGLNMIRRTHASYDGHEPDRCLACFPVGARFQIACRPQLPTMRAREMGTVGVASP